MTQDGIAEAKCAGQVVEGLLVALDVHENVVRLVDFGDGVGQLASTPVFEAMHAAFAGGDHAFIALDHGGHLLALIRMDEKNDLVMPHEFLLTDWGAARCEALLGAARSLWRRALGARAIGGANGTQPGVWMLAVG